MRRGARAIAISSALLLCLATPAVAGAFCGFYVDGSGAELTNDATQVVLMRDGMRTVLSMQNTYSGPPADFAMVVPVPVVLEKRNVKTLPPGVFDRIDKLDAPRLVEYWEQDPCPPVRRPRFEDDRLAGRQLSVASFGASEARMVELGVKVEAKFTVAEYDIVVLSAKDSGGLVTWLTEERYKIPEGSGPYLQPYLQRGSKFFVAKIDAKKVRFENGRAVLSPLRFHYDSEQFALPIRLGLVNAKGKQDLIVHVLGRGHRYEVANYPNVAAPTNVEVTDATRGQFGAFYAALFDRVLEKNPGAIVTEYAWQAGSCDPCPTPPLDLDALAAFGADVLPSVAERADPATLASSFVLTRLHARYAKDLSADLVLRVGAPVTGGRESWVAYPGDSSRRMLERGMVQAPVNNFQARFIIRHPWTGPMACAEPRRGIWGGPPASMGRAVPPAPAQDLAFAPRGAVKLSTFVREDTTDLDVQSAPPSEGHPPLGVVVPPVIPGHACGCSLAPGAGHASLALFSGLAGLLAWRRRRP